jgi:hypothetical protein
MYHEDEDRCATPAEACREYAHNVGQDNHDWAWILTDWDTWERNPFFNGPACHLLEDPEGRDELFMVLHQDCTREVCRGESFDVRRPDNCYYISPWETTMIIPHDEDDLPF